MRIFVTLTFIDSSLKNYFIPNLPSTCFNLASRTPSTRRTASIVVSNFARIYSIRNPINAALNSTGKPTAICNCVFVIYTWLTWCQLFLKNFTAQLQYSQNYLNALGQI